MSCPEPYSWHTEKDGSRTCSYCGSLHPEDFVDIMYRYVQGEDGVRFSPGKPGKTYANRAGVRNALDGGIKFYGNHVDDQHRSEIHATYQFALAKFQHEMAQKYGAGNF